MDFSALRTGAERVVRWWSMIHWIYQGSGLWLCLRDTGTTCPPFEEIGRVEGVFHESGEALYVPVTGLGRSQKWHSAKTTLQAAQAVVEAVGRV